MGPSSSRISAGLVDCPMPSVEATYKILKTAWIATSNRTNHTKVVDSNIHISSGVIPDL
jgi:hypothetical protein